MSYRLFYDFCQQQKELPISRKVVQPKACELAGVTGVRVFYDSKMPPGALRGYFVSADNTEHPFHKQSGGLPVVVVQRELNRCWTRFVWVKELMHLFDRPLEFVTGGLELETVAAGFTSPELVRSPQMASEVLCFWRALAALCPEEIRQRYLQRREQGEQLTDLQIATELRLPEQYVPRLFHTAYKEIVTRLLGEEE